MENFDAADRWAIMAVEQYEHRVGSQSAQAIELFDRLAYIFRGARDDDEFAADTMQDTENADGDHAGLPHADYIELVRDAIAAGISARQGNLIRGER